MNSYTSVNVITYFDKYGKLATVFLQEKLKKIGEVLAGSHGRSRPQIRDWKRNEMLTTAARGAVVSPHYLHRRLQRLWPPSWIFHFQKLLT